MPGSIAVLLDGNFISIWWQIKSVISGSGEFVVDQNTGTFGGGSSCQQAGTLERFFGNRRSIAFGQFDHKKGSGSDSSNYGNNN